ncbi:aminoglycoside phosphotransferase family protein [Nocardioides bruguierae]|uniref:Aminoglycoside phosphotransferase family protein n=1 Tax=Nocardioides bruguierae TaxID=2945102 RepID=A0A9X2D9K4_9ACTN|nr:aminoglycoside phosphotransferase family protein [Nocardioides bruguierae]MCM0621868.1 aminoglycoside phosphotransferase family protein [Nocardioides bruguierae]
MSALRLPPEVEAMAGRGPDWAAWVERVPATLRDLLEEWSLTRTDDEVWHGHASVVLAVRDREGRERVLKVAFPDVETEHEALALRTWAGRGAAQLVTADPRRRAVLLERLERRDLHEEWDVAACETVADLYRQLHVPAPPQLMTVPAYVGRYVERLRALPRNAPLPRRMVEQALALVRDLGADERAVGTLVHGDLHYGNVLHDVTGEAVAIDPHAMSGEPAWEVAPLLWNRFEETAGDRPRALRARFETVVDAAGLDEDRARGWAVVRLVLNAFWALEDAAATPEGARDDAGVRRYVTQMLTVAKSLDP